MQKILIFNPFKHTHTRGIQIYTHEIETLFIENDRCVEVVSLPSWSKNIPSIFQTLLLVFCQQVVLPIKCYLARPSLVFDAYNSYSVFSACFFNYICVVHDFIPFLEKRWYFNAASLYKFSLYKWVKFFPKLKIYYISEKIAQDSVDYIPSAKKDILPNIIQPLSSSQESEPVDRYVEEFITSSKKENALLITTITGNYAHKDFEGLLSLLSQINRKIYLCVFGLTKDFNNHNQEKIYANIKVLVIEPSPSWVLGHVIRQSNLFVFHSLQEGFGRPIIEALMEGSKVICSDVSPSLAYVTNKAKKNLFVYQDKDNFVDAFKLAIKSVNEKVKPDEVLTYSRLDIYHELNCLEYY